MGMLILAGLVLLAYGVYREMRGAEPPPAAPPAAPSVAAVETAVPGAARPPAFTTTLDLPAGTSLRSTGEAAGRLVVVAVLPDGEERVLLIDPATGALLGTLALPAR